MSNNRLRLYALKTILEKYSDEDHYLNIDDLNTYLENEYGLNNIYRKTLYEDLHFLESIGYEIIYQHKKGYYLNKQPFSLAEIKILSDSLNSVKNLDDTFLLTMQTKLNSFLSLNEKKTLTNLTFKEKHEKTYFLYHLETLLTAYKHKHLALIKHNDKEEEVEVVYFDFSNYQYYLLYAYPPKKKIYRLNFRNIDGVKESNKPQVNSFSLNEIRKYLKESYRGYHHKDNLIIHLKINTSKPQLKNWLRNDFPSIEFFKDEALLKASNNPFFMANLLAYQEDITILGPQEFITTYVTYLKEIIAKYEIN